MAATFTQTRHNHPLVQLLKNLSFPATRDDIVAQAELNGADDDILDNLDTIEPATYYTLTQVVMAFGEMPSSREDSTIAWSGNAGSYEKLEKHEKHASQPKRPGNHRMI